MKTKSKIIVTVLSLVMILCSLLLVGCQDGTPDQTLQPPAPIYKVHSVTIKMDGEAVEGTLTTDVNTKELQLTATVQKDAQADGTVTYTSNNPKVATIDQSGKVVLLSKGESVITARAGGKTHTIVLIVRDDFSAKEYYTITVNGGTSSVSKAAPGEYVTLSAIIPEHKDFQRWNFSVRGIITNGNIFKMPAEDIVITADYADKLYTLNVVGAANVYADGEEISGEIVGNNKHGTDPEYDIVAYGVKYGTEIKVTAYDDPEGMMFVGWDGGVLNNRVGEMGYPEYTFEMPGESHTVWAHYSPLKTTIFTASNPDKYWNASNGSKLITEGVPAGESADPDLEGLSGYRLTFTYGESAISDTPENIRGSVLNTIEEGTNTMKAIFKNHGDQDVTLEVYATYYGNICTSGYVTVPAHSTVTKYFTGGLGINNPWMGIALRENIAGSDGTFNVDMVLGSAPMYPEGDPLLMTTGKAQLVQLDMSTDSKSAYNWDGSRPFIFNSKYAVLTNSIYGAQFNGKVPAARSVKITNMPEYDPENPYTTIYARVINNATSGDFLSQFDICVGTDPDPRNGSNTYYTTVVHEEVGDVVVVAITVPRTENDGDFYLSIRKTTTEGTGTYYPHNFSIVLAYNNVFDYKEEAE